MSSNNLPPTSGVENAEFFSAEESERRMNLLLRSMGGGPLTDEERATLADMHARNGGER